MKLFAAPVRFSVHHKLLSQPLPPQNLEIRRYLRDSLKQREQGELQMLRLLVRSEGLKLEEIVYGGGDENTDGSVEVSTQKRSQWYAERLIN